MSRDNDPGRRRSRALWQLGVRTAARGALLGAQRLLPGSERRARTLGAMGDDWFDTLGDMKGAAMKLGQFASQFRGGLPDALVDRLAGLQQGATPLPYSEILPVLVAGLGDPARHFAWLDPDAFAAASMGQVHRAKLHDGRAVIVKLRYPDVAASIDDDIRQLARVFKTARVINIPADDIDASLAEIAARLHEEADYRIERDNLRAIRETGVTDGIVLPDAIDDLCGESVLVLTEIAAMPAARAALDLLPVRQNWAERLARWLAHQCLVTGLVHADPNPGNFGFLPDGRIALYDFGCIKRMPPALVGSVRDALTAGLREDWPAFHRAVDAVGSLRPHAADAADRLTPLYRNTLAASLGPLVAEATYDFADDDILTRMRALTGQHLRHVRDFRAVPDMIFVGRTLSGYHWLLRQLAAPVPVRGLIDAALAATPASAPR